MLPDGLLPEFDFDAWERPAVFKWLQQLEAAEENAHVIGQLKRVPGCV